VALKMSQREVDGVIVVALADALYWVKKATRCEKSEGAACEQEKNRAEYEQHHIHRQRRAGYAGSLAPHGEEDGASLRLCHWATSSRKCCRLPTADGVRCFEHGKQGRGEFFEVVRGAARFKFTMKSF